MLVLLATLANAGTDLPAVAIVWKKDDVVLIIDGPEGEHVAEDAPADLDLNWDGGWLQLGTTGIDVAEGVFLRNSAGKTVQGTLRVSLCEDVGTTCRMVDAVIKADLPNSKKGLMLANVSHPVAAEPVTKTAAVQHHDSFAAALRQDAATVHEAAVKQATADNKLVLMDFSAVWCPPCNLMSAQVLHATPAPDELDGFVVAVLDVDDKSSWTLKDRYHVGGYPTVVAIQPDGTELGRYLGYTDAEAFRSWLADVDKNGWDDKVFIEAGPDKVTPERAGEIAWKLLSSGTDDVAAWLERASAEPDQEAFRKARLATKPTVEDVLWLTENAPGTTMEWIYQTGDLDETVEGKAALRAAVDVGLHGASGLESADLLYVAASLGPDSEKVLLYGAAAAAVRESLTGDPRMDRGNYTWLAGLMAKSGDVDGAVALLDQATEAFADEPTFLLKATKILIGAERADEALERSTVGLERAWGDNYLRMAAAHADALVAAGKTEDSKAFAAGVLAKADRPDDGADVRTFRYLDHLEQRANPGDAKD